MSNHGIEHVADDRLAKERGARREKRLAKLRSNDLAATLSAFTNEELEPIYELLTGDPMETLSLDSRVKQAHPNHAAYSDLIAHHLRLSGGNSFANVARGSDGPSYHEIVRDVCGSRGVKVTGAMTAVEMEQALLTHLIDQLPPAEREKVLAEAAKQYSYSPSWPIAPLGLIVRALGVVSGPVGWTITGLLAVGNISGPALRLTTPAVILIAGTRQARLWRETMEIES